MATKALSARFCETAKPEPGKRQSDYFDEIVRGLSFNVSSGGTRTWFLVFTRPADGKRARAKIGNYPDLSLVDARQKARDMRAEIAQGADPIVVKKAAVAAVAAASSAPTVADLVESYLAREASKNKSHDEIARRLRQGIAATIGTVKLADLHRRDITKAIDKIADRGAAVSANRTFADARAMLRWAKARGDIDVDIVAGMKKPAEEAPRERVLDPEELRTIWRNAAEADMADGTARIIRLCLISAQRVGEISGMTRGEIDLEAGIWTIPPERVKNSRAHRVPLAALAVEIIQEQIAHVDAAVAARKKRGGRVADPLPWIFPAREYDGPITPAAVSKAIRRSDKAFGIAHWTPHDLRRTAATNMEEMGVSPFVIGHILNHATVTKSSITSKVYARYSYDKEKKEVMELWADRLEVILKGEGANILLMARRG